MSHPSLPLRGRPKPAACTHDSLQGKEVEYSLRAIPLGGYVGFPDDDPDSPYPKDDPDLLRNRPVGQRALVISAGIIANVVLAYSVLLAQVTQLACHLEARPCANALTATVQQAPSHDKELQLLRLHVAALVGLHQCGCPYT